jgi:hypothetical protein
MNLPGFTAETSLRSGGNIYRSMGGHSLGSMSQVLPQLPIGFCQANCDRIQDPFLHSVCELQCLDQGGGGGTGGGGGQVCRPQCGRCLPDSESPTGRSKFCLLRNCDDVTRAC